MFIEVLFLITLGIAVADMLVLIQISTGYGIYFIIASQVLTGVFGLYKLRSMDFNLFFFLDAELKKGEKIIKELWEEAWILSAACLLIIPGLASDLVGGLCMVPVIRRFFLDYVTEVN